MKKIISITLILFSFVVLSGCAYSHDVSQCFEPNEYTYGFFSGLWHGTITFFSLIGSIFNSNISIYAVNNTGFWYDFGFVFGIGGILRFIRTIINNLV